MLIKYLKADAFKDDIAANPLLSSKDTQNCRIIEEPPVLGIKNGIFENADHTNGKRTFFQF